MEIRKATRKRSKLRIGFSAPSGGGKTFSALQLASGLTTMDRICVIDTEQGSSELYSHFGPYDVLQLDAPYSPDKYIEAIKMVEKTGKYDVLIIDSVSHEWDGEGGCLEMHERYGGRYQDWSKVTPKHRKFLQTILQCPMHVLTTTRRKQDYDMVKDGNRTKVTKVGLKEVQREGFEYELTINFDISQDHYATASKDRTNLFAANDPFKITPETGKMILEWNNGGVAASKPVKKPSQKQLGHMFGALKEAGYTPETLKMAIHGMFGKESTKDLDYKEWEHVVNVIKVKGLEDVISNTAG